MPLVVLLPLLLRALVLIVVLVHGHGSRVLLGIVVRLLVRLRGTVRMVAGVVVFGFIDRVLVNNDAAAMAVLAFGRKGLYQAGAQTLARHLYQAQGSDLGYLVARAVAAQSLLQAAQNQVLVFRQDHVNKVHHDHAAQIAQAHLAHDFFGRLQVIAGHGLFQVAAGAGELAGVDIDDGHSLSAVNDQGTARWQPYLARERLMQLLINTVGGKGILAAVVLRLIAHHAIRKVRCH